MQLPASGHTLIPAHSSCRVIFGRSWAIGAVFIWGWILRAEPAGACTCGVALVATSIGPGHTQDAGAPVLFMDDEWAEPVLLVDGEPVEVKTTKIIGDDLCSASLVAYVPVEPISVGATLSLIDPELQAWVDHLSEDEWEELKSSPYFEPERYRYEYSMKIAEPRATFGVELSVDVSWRHRPPEEFSGGLCAANALLPYENHGSAYVKVRQISGTETKPAKFYVSAQVLLPEGEPYQNVGSSSVDDEGQIRVGIWAPLTHAKEVPECVFVTVYDHFLAPVFAQRMCPDPGLITSATEDAHAYEAFRAQLRELPVDPAVESQTSAGCTYATPGPSAPFRRNSVFSVGLVLFVLLGRVLTVPRRGHS